MTSHVGRSKNRWRIWGWISRAMPPRKSAPMMKVKVVSPTSTPISPAVSPREP